VVSSDQHLTADLADVSNDIQVIAKKNPSVDWGWYQQGFGPEPFDGTPISALDPAEIRPETVTKEEVASRIRRKRLLGVLPIPGTTAQQTGTSSSR